MRNKISNALIALLVLLALYKGANLLAKRTDPLPAVPQQNGYATLVEAGAKIQIPKADVASTTKEEILQTAEANREPLAKARQALRTEIGVPLEPSRKFIQQHAEDLKALKQLGTGMGLQCRAELIRGNTNAGAAYLVDMILLGQAMARGGIIADGVSGMAVELVGAESLANVVANVDDGFAKQAAGELQEAEKKRENAERLVATDQNWSHATFGLASRFTSSKDKQAQKENFQLNYMAAANETQKVIAQLLSRGSNVTVSGKKP